MVGRITTCSDTSVGTLFRYIQGCSSERIVGSYTDGRTGVRRRWKIIVQWFRIARCESRCEVSAWTGLIAGFGCGERIGYIGLGLKVLLVYNYYVPR